MSCYQCSGDLRETNLEKIGVCINPLCPNFGVLQISLKNLLDDNEQEDDDYFFLMSK
jgi:hypothetical protein